MFGPQVAALVAAMTHDESLPPAERSRASIERCQALGKTALSVKAADLLDNLRFYLPEANPNRLPQLADSLAYFLDISAGELAGEPSRGELSRYLDTIKKNNSMHERKTR